jgi:ankyrin repeat protein
MAAAGLAGCALFWEVPATPLQQAAWKGDTAAIQAIVKAGAFIDEPDDQGSSPLYWAARGGHAFGPHQCRGEAPDRPEVLRTLLELGADPNVQDNRPKGFGRSSGWTPLFVALHHEQFKSAAVLLEHGADPNIRSDQGMSVMEIASGEGAPRELIELILARGFDAQKARTRD